MKNHLKVPLRSVYCPTLKSWALATLWCHLVLRLWPDVIDVGSQPDFALTDGAKFLDQHGSWFRRVCESRGLKVPEFAKPWATELPKS